jgi:hypothetical protein
MREASSGNDSSSRGRKWLGGRRHEEEDRALSHMSGRLRALGDPAFKQWKGPEDTDAPTATERTLEAELQFVAGPRIDTTITLGAGTLALDVEGNVSEDPTDSDIVVNMWAQGQHFMLRPARGVRVSGSRPALPVVVLEDGDDIEWGPHRVRVRLVRTERSAD